MESSKKVSNLIFVPLTSVLAVTPENNRNAIRSWRTHSEYSITPRKESSSPSSPDGIGGTSCELD